MTQHRTRQAVVAVAAALALALPACGGADDVAGLVGGTTTVSSDEGSAATTAETSETTGTTETSGTTETTETPGTTGTSQTTGAPADPADLELARSAALELGDLPEGWTLDDEDEDTGSFGAADDDEFQEACPGVFEEVRAIISEGGEPAEVTRSFSAAAGMPSVESAPVVFETEELAARAGNLVGGDEFLRCMSDELAAGAESDGGAEMGDPEIEQLEIDAPGLDAAGGIELVIPVSSEGTSMTMRLSIVVLRSGRLLHMLMLLTVDGMAPFPEAQDVIDAAVARTAGA